MSELASNVRLGFRLRMIRSHLCGNSSEKRSPEAPEKLEQSRIPNRTRQCARAEACL
jgi:hypothetical protein